MAIAEIEACSGGGSSSDSGTFIYPTSAGTVTIPVKIKASTISIVIIKDSTTVGVCGCRFNSDGSQGLTWFGDTYSGGRFTLNTSALSYARNSDNSITFTSSGSGYLGGATAEWVAYE